MLRGENPPVNVAHSHLQINVIPEQPVLGAAPQGLAQQPTSTGHVLLAHLKLSSQHPQLQEEKWHGQRLHMEDGKISILQICMGW